MPVVRPAYYDEREGINRHIKKKCKRYETPVPSEFRHQRLEHHANRKPRPCGEKENQKGRGQNVPAVKKVKTVSCSLCLHHMPLSVGRLCSRRHILECEMEQGQGPSHEPYSILEATGELESLAPFGRPSIFGAFRIGKVEASLIPNDHTSHDSFNSAKTQCSGIKCLPADQRVESEHSIAQNTETMVQLTRCPIKGKEILKAIWAVASFTFFHQL